MGAGQRCQVPSLELELSPEDCGGYCRFLQVGSREIGSDFSFRKIPLAAVGRMVRWAGENKPVVGDSPRPPPPAPWPDRAVPLQLRQQVQRLKNI